ncbi:MAG: sulfatase-like hydrolase/transferase [Caldilineaceae bacterium]|nr:sulfatase-like hydrolase/transferase [Caldilineaceae bacterium]
MSKPNLLFILTDQQRADSLACYGNTHIQAPNLNRLAEESFVFENAYVSQPVCSPSRATLLTGTYPHTARVPACNIRLPEEIPTIAELVDDDYQCAWLGKWHLGDEIFAQRGFDEWVGSEDSYRAHYSTAERLDQLSDYHHFLIEQGLEPDRELLGQRVFSRHFEASLPEELTKAAFLGERTADFIRNRGDQPFVAFVSYLEPHPPHTGPLNDLYDPATLPVGPHFLQKPEANASVLNRVMAAYYMESEEYGFDLRTEAGWRAVRARYWGNVSLVDRSVGKILAALEESGQAENTIVVFTSDHGEMAGDHGILGKCVLYEESVRVPLLIRDPRRGSEQKLIPGNVSHIDLLPTLLDLMGQPIPAHLQGESRVAVLNGEHSLADNDVFIEWNGRTAIPYPVKRR